MSKHLSLLNQTETTSEEENNHKDKSKSFETDISTDAQTEISANFDSFISGDESNKLQWANF